MVAFCLTVMVVENGSLGGAKRVYAADTRTGVYHTSYTANGKTTTEWCYLKNGKVQYSYTGFASNSNGWWYCKNGKVDFSKKDIVQGTVNGKNGWWFVSDGKVKFIDSVEQNSNGWWFVKNGMVDFGFEGIAKNSYGWWYIKKGKAVFDYNGYIKLKSGGTVTVKSGKITANDGNGNIKSLISSSNYIHSRKDHCFHGG